MKENDLSPDVAVVGAGVAGLSAAALSSMLGARTMLIEKGRFGGDCTWTGCVPSKTLLDASRRWKIAIEERGEPSPDEHGHAFMKAMKRVRDTRETIYQHADTPERFEAMGVDVRRGEARFVDAERLRIHGTDGIVDVRPRYVMVATGSRPRIPAIPGLGQIPFLTTESIFELEERPESLIITGGGPTGVELAQSFVRFGVRVTILEREDRILGTFIPNHTDRLVSALRSEGVDIRTDVQIQGIERFDEGIRIRAAGASSPMDGERLLVVAGRTANTDRLGADAAGLKLDGDVLEVNASCRSNLRHVYGIGDVATRARHTHTAGVMAKTAVLRALYKIPGSFDARSMPAAIYTDPGLGQIGWAEDGPGRRSSSEVTVSTDRLDRALIDKDPEGEIRIRTNRTGRIVGASVLSANAGELVGLLAVAIRNGIGVRALSDVVFPYPTYSEAIARAGSKVVAGRIPDSMIRIAARIAGLRGDHAGLDPNEIG